MWAQHLRANHAAHKLWTFAIAAFAVGASPARPWVPLPHSRLLQSDALAPPPGTHDPTWDVPAGERVALCLVGEKRTFDMPIVHTSIAKWVAELRADVFFYRNAQFRTGNWQASASCQDNHTAMAMLNPLLIAYTEELPQCSMGGPAQFHHVGHCLVAAANYAAAYGHRPYDIFVRVRPDIVLETPAIPPWAILKTGDTRLLVVRPQADLVFAMTASGLRTFLDVGERFYRGCHVGMNGLEGLSHLQGRVRSKKGEVHTWELTLAVVRDARRITNIHSAGSNNATTRAAFIGKLTQRAQAEPWLFRCALAATPVHPSSRPASAEPSAILDTTSP